MAHQGETATRECPACHTTVPAAVFCGRCGADPEAPVDTWTVLLRPAVYATAHRESIWKPPRVSSTLFPRLPGVTRKPFRVGLIAALVVIVVLSALRMNGTLGVISVIGWPLLFLIYVWQSDVFRDLPLRILAVAAVLGGGLGVGWWLSTSRVLASTYGVSTGTSLLLLQDVLNVGLLISMGGAVLMVLPAFVTRLFRVPVRESLDGFVVGAFGALWYSTAATTTLLAPQFAEGLMQEQSGLRLLDDSITYGIVNAITTTAAGGLVGLSLWFSPDRRRGRDPERARTALTLCTVLAVGWYLAVWGLDSLGLPRTVSLVTMPVLAILALITARTGIQIALLHESPDPATGEPILCVHCERVVPDMAFCASCGCASRASSRSSRRIRRASPPVLETPSHPTAL